MKMLQKSVLIGASALMMCSMLAACGSNNDTSKAAESKNPSDSPKPADS